MAAQRLLRLLPTDSFLGAAYGAAVEVPKAVGEAEAGKLVWIQAAYEGEFKGYRFPMKLTSAFFASLISNLHADPQFKKGEDGYGAQPVVRMDYEHASAMPPTEGSIPSQGVPAPGWVCDAEMRPGTDKAGNPRMEFWTLCSVGEQLRGQIKNGEYRFTSIDAPLESKDPVTGEKRGPKLRALAMTNDPFLRDLSPATIAASASVYGRAESPEELVIGLRQVLQLAEAAPAAEIAAALEALGAAYEAGVRAPGYPDGFGYLLDSIRQLVGLPVLATADQIVEAAGQALGALSASTSTMPAPPAPTPGNAAMTAPAANALFLTTLAALLCCAEREDAILAAATKASGASAILDEMMKTYGAKDPKDLADKAGAARDAASKAAEFGGKMAELLATLDGNAQEETTQETEQIAASLGFAKDTPRGISARSVILTSGLAARRAALGIVVGENGPDGKPILTLGAKDPSKLAAFRAEYPLDDKRRAAALLTTPIVAGSGGMQLGGAHTGATGAGPAGAPVPEHIAALSTYPGDNNIQRAIALLSDKQAGFSKLDWARQNFIAGRYLTTGKAA